MLYLFSLMLWANANEPTPTTLATPQAALTIRDIKSQCKEDGHKGPELVECIKKNKTHLPSASKPKE